LRQRAQEDEMEQALKVKELELTDIKMAQKNFELAVREVHQVMKDIEDGVLEDGAKVTLTLTFAFEPQKGLEGVDVSCQGAIKLPKYPASSVHALRRLGRLKFVQAEQDDLPGIRGVRAPANLKSIDGAPKEG